MAKTKSKSTKLSRRQMVVLLGSGGVLGALGNSEGAEAAPASVCVNVKAFQGKNKQGELVLSGYPCCRESAQLFMDGFSKAAPTVKGHLQVLKSALEKNRNSLQEYSIMIWGLRQEERDSLMETIANRFSMSEMK
jgi:hypothetical protein